MSSCSTSSVPQAHTPLLSEAQQHMAAPAGAPRAPQPPADGEAPNGQHHLLRHVLSAQQCSDALRHFGTADSKAAARAVNRMSQRELRDMFAKVYSVHTNSNNNTWLRRKLLEAVGASRRFYNAAAKSGRPKAPRRAPAAPAGGAGATAPRAPRPKRSASPTLPGTPPSPGGPRAVPATGLYHRAGPALPAGSPRALQQRLRGPRAPTCASGSHLAAYDGAALAAPQPQPFADRYTYAPPQQLQQQQPLRLRLVQRTPFGAAALQHSSEDDASSEGSEGAQQHPRALAPHGLQHGASPRAPAYACAPRPQQQPWLAPAPAPYASGYAAVGCQFAPVPTPAGAPQPGLASPPPWGATALPRLPSLTTLPSLLAAYPSSELASAPPSCGLACAPSSDLGLGLLAALEPPPPAGAKADSDVDEWLAWDDWCLPALL